jgi:hypothetical protein
VIFVTVRDVTGQEQDPAADRDAERNDERRDDEDDQKGPPQ